MQIFEFAQLGHGPSLVQLLYKDPSALDCMSGSQQTSAVASLSQVHLTLHASLHFAAQILKSQLTMSLQNFKLITH